MPRERPPVGQLSPQPWMSCPETLAVINALQAGGQQVRFVGGCVRDALCGQVVHDIDIATPDPPEQVLALLDAAGLRAIPTGIEHGTITALSGGESFEITTLRQDLETDGRRATVAWTSDWMADAARRDLTINALSARPDGAIYDYFDGLQDLSHGRVRFIGRPMQRIEEDALRILRFFRFHGRYGRGTPDADGLEACRAMAGRLESLSGERIAQEMQKILAAPSATEIMLDMQGVRILEVVLPELKDMGRLRQMVFLETRGLCLDGLSADPVRRLGAMMTDSEDCHAVADRLRLSNSQRNRLYDMLRITPPAFDAPREEFLRALRHSGSEAMVDALLLQWAQQRALEGRTNAQRSALYRQRLEDALHWQPPQYPLQGRHLLAVGLRPGPRIGDLLAAGELYWESHDFQPSAEEILQQIMAETVSPTGDSDKLS
jgi:poly(A) polymerase